MGGWFGILMAVFLVVLFSRRAQVLWALLLLLALGFSAVFENSALAVFVGEEFFVVRVLFLAVMAAVGELFAGHAFAQFLRGRIEATRLPIWLGSLGVALLFCLGILLFDIVHWYGYAAWATLFFVLAWRCPKPEQRARVTWTQSAINGALLLGTAGSCLLLVEFGLRAFAAPPAYTMKGTIVRVHEAAGFTHIENATQLVETREFSVRYSISSQGLRDRVYGTKEEGVYRIVCLGDSFTFGYGIDEVDGYPRALERNLLAMHPGREIEVVNMGTSSYGLWQSEIKFREAGLALNPDLLVLQVYPNNDVRDALRREGIVLQAYEPRYHNFMDDLDNLHRRLRVGQLRRMSRTFDLLHYFVMPKYRYALSKLRPQFRGERYHERIVERPPQAPRHWSFETLLKEPYVDLELGFDLLERSMVDLVALCEEEGIPVVMLYVPGEDTVNIERTIAWLRAQEMESSIYDFQRTSDWMDEVCTAHRWPLVNTKGAFDRRVMTEDGLMYPEDGHPTKRGHQLIADLLGEHIEEFHLGAKLPPEEG